MYEVCIVGLGYIGLPTLLMLGSYIEGVVGYDLNETIITSLNAGKLHFEEEGLIDVYNSAIKNGTCFTQSIPLAKTYIVAVPTPYDEKTKKIDAKFVINAVVDILTHAGNDTTIVIESTISPGTIDKVIYPIVQKMGFERNKNVFFAHAPERIIPGNMIFELKHNSRTIGVDDVEVGKKIKELYGSFCDGDIIITDIKSAEMSKVVENTFRDINIAFANELAKICSEDDLDVYEIIKIANHHPRVNILSPGPGVGGHCISVDPWFLVGYYPKLTKLIRAARDVNSEMPKFILKRILEIMKQNNIDSFSEVGLYGITYKENVDDTRESPTLQLLKFMDQKDCSRIKLYDPYVDELKGYEISQKDTFYKSVKLVVILVSHNELEQDLDVLKSKIVFDTKNVLNGENVYKI